MKTYAHKTGALLYVLWGLLHIAGAALLLMQAFDAGATTVLTTIGSGVPTSQIPLISSGLVAAVLAYYAWNLLWIGCLVAVVAVRLVWRNKPTGYWLNLIVVSAVDLGLFVLLILPGYMSLVDGLLGIALWLPAVGLSSIGMLANRLAASRQIA